MKKHIFRKIITLISKAQEMAQKVGIPNILQSGLIKEMIIAEILNHELIHSKRDADACHPQNPQIKYEYLSCYEGGTGKVDRMFKEPPTTRQASLYRITRNQKIYFAVFYKNQPLKVKVIYELEPDIVVKETEKQLDKSKNSISHIGFSESWVKENSIIVYQNNI